MKPYLHVLTVATVAASFAFGQDAPPKPERPDRGQRPPPEERFKKLDTNADGSLSPDEFKASPMAQRNPERANEIFKKMDADANGSVSLDEFKKHRSERPHRRPGGRGGPGGPSDKPADKPADKPVSE